MNADGKVVIPPRFVSAEMFVESGLAKVCINSGDDKYTCGVIDRSGVKIIPTEFSDLKLEDPGIWVGRKKNKSYFFDTRGKWYSRHTTAIFERTSIPSRQSIGTNSQREVCLN